MNRPNRRMVVAVALASVCMPVAAQDKKSPPDSDLWQMPYHAGFWRDAAVSAGRSAYDFDCQGNTLCDEKNKSAFKIAAGGKFNRTLGIEIGYVNLGDASLPALRGRARAEGVDLSMVASASVFDRIGAVARIGTVYGWTRSRLRIASISCILPGPPETDHLCNVARSDRGFGLRYGAGLSIRIAPRVELRVDWDRYRFPFSHESYFDRVGGKRDIDLWSAGFGFLF